jgi:hypothetical protein
MKDEVAVFVSYHFKQFCRSVVEATIVIETPLGRHDLGPASLKKGLGVNRYQFNFIPLPEKISKLA